MKKWVVSDGLSLFDQEGTVVFDRPPLIAGEQISMRRVNGEEWCLIVPDEPIFGADIRSVILSLPLESQALVSSAVSVAHWYKDHSFCPRCGTRTRRLMSELAMVCDRCRYRSYPRVSPCVIVLVTRADQVLLATHKRSSVPIFTVLAGFIEAGESAEEAVVREVKEEAGITVGDVKYMTSQAWPFPSQLMLAYRAEYISGDLSPDLSELSDIGWFDRSNLPETLPPVGTVSAKMIEMWLAS